MEAEAAKLIGAGIAATALIGAGIGVGIVFGSYLAWVGASGDAHQLAPWLF